MEDKIIVYIIWKISWMFYVLKNISTSFWNESSDALLLIFHLQLQKDSAYNSNFNDNKRCIISVKRHITDVFSSFGNWFLSYIYSHKIFSVWFKDSTKLFKGALLVVLKFSRIYKLRFIDSYRVLFSYDVGSVEKIYLSPKMSTFRRIRVSTLFSKVIFFVRYIAEVHQHSWIKGIFSHSDLLKLRLALQSWSNVIRSASFIFRKNNLSSSSSSS